MRVETEPRATEAVDAYGQAIARGERFSLDSPLDSPAVEREIAYTRNALGAALTRLERFEEAERELMTARDTVDRHPSRAWSGLPEILTNLAQTCLSKPEPDLTRAKMALLEALAVARSEGNGDQMVRARAKLLQLQASRSNAAERDAAFSAGVEEAVRQGRWGTAYLRRCMEAELALEEGRHDDGLRAVADARALEAKVDASEPNVARLRLKHALLLIRGRGDTLEAVKVLIEGAGRWYGRLAAPLHRVDFNNVAEETHEHFRLLARLLVDAGRHDEALVAFESGRALAYAAEVDPDVPSRLCTHDGNPFAEDGMSVRTELLGTLRKHLSDGAVAMVPAALPPEFVAFVLTASKVEIVRVPFPDPSAAGPNPAATVDLDHSLSAIPTLLAEDSKSAADAVPAFLHELGAQLSAIVGQRQVRKIAPHATLHAVPWRAILRHAGIPWTQLPLVTNFSLLFSSPARAAPPACIDATGFGHGDALGVQFINEARAFVTSFGSRGTLSADCTPGSVMHGLATAEGAVIISAHGGPKRLGRSADLAFALELQGPGGPATGSVDSFADDWIPAVVRPAFVDLSACWSGVYEMGWGDYPVGIAPDLLRRGCQYCLVRRYAVRASFALAFATMLSERLAAGIHPAAAVAEALSEAESSGWDLWRDLACVELLARD